MLDKAYLVCKCILVLSMAFAFVYTPIITNKTAKSEIQKTRKAVVAEIRETRKEALKEIKDTRKDITDLVNVRFNSLQKYATSWLNTADNRMGSLEKHTFQLASDIRLDLFKRVDTFEGDINSQLTTTNGHIGTLATTYAALPSQLGGEFNARFGEQTNCGINKLCWQNLTTDLMIDARYSARDFSTSSKVFTENFPIFIGHSERIVGNFANITNNIEYWTHPRWYIRALNYGLRGVNAFGTLHPAGQAINGSISILDK